MANIYSAFGITGVTSKRLDKTGRIYVGQNDLGGGTFETRIYKDSAHITLLAHTATYTTVGAKDVVADGSSGFGGTVTVETLQATTTDVTLDYYRFAIVQAIVANLLTVQGPELDDGTTATVEELWRAPSGSNVAHMPLFLPGAYAEDSSATALWDIAKYPGVWLHGRAHMCRFGVCASNVNATDPPTVNVMVNGAIASPKNSSAGVDVGTAGDTEYDDALTAGNVIAEYGDPIEVAVTETQASSDDLNLTVHTQWVIE